MADPTPQKQAAPGRHLRATSGGPPPSSAAVFPTACPTDTAPRGDPAAAYNLPGPQVEPQAGYWTLSPRPLPRVVTIAEVRALTEDPASDYFVPPYPTDAAILDWEIAELAYLEANRDDPAALAGAFPTAAPAAVAATLPASFAAELSATTREPASDFLQLDPPPFGAIFNIGSRPQYAITDVNQQHLRRQDLQNGLLPPVVTTGRQLARMFQEETPGLYHRHALTYLLYRRAVAPPRHARVWMALDVAVYSALLAAWYYKWAAPAGAYSYRQRPYEYDRDATYRVLFDDIVDDFGEFDKCARSRPCPSPGTPRHPAYPSGHSTYSAAASAVLAYFFPGEAAEFDRLANNIGTARLWGGVHWRSDHVAGQRIGRAVAKLVVQQLEGDCVPVFDESNTAPDPVPAHDALGVDALAARFGACPPGQDTLQPQRDTPFPDCTQAKSAF